MSTEMQRQAIALEQNNGQLLRLIALKVGVADLLVDAHLTRELEIRYPLPEEIV